MRLELHLTQRPELRLQLSPQLIQRIEILQLGAQDLEDMVENELANNDALVAEKPTPKELEPKSPEAEQRQDESAAEANPENSEARVELDYWNDTYRGRSRARGGDDDEDPKQQALNNTPARARTLAEHLEDQLQLTDADQRIQRLARFLIENLDRNGWLKVPLAEIVVPFHEEFTIADAEEALKVVQSLEPAGVGARDSRECLLLQLNEEHPLASYLKKLIEFSLEDVGRNRSGLMERRGIQWSTSSISQRSSTFCTRTSGRTRKFDSVDHFRPGKGLKFFRIASIRFFTSSIVMFRSFATFGRRLRATSSKECSIILRR